MSAAASRTRVDARHALALLAIVAVGAWLRWPYLTKGMWWDEYDVVFFGSMPLAELLRAFAALESHPPGYALLQKALLPVLGDGVAALRAVSLVAGVATLLATEALGRATVGRRAGLVAAALLAVLPAHVEFSTNARSLYPGFTLLATLSSLAFARLLACEAQRRARWVVAYGVVTGLSLLTHYYTVVVVATHALCFLAARGRRGADARALVVAWGIAGALFYPWFWISNALPSSAGFGSALTPWVPSLGLDTLVGVVQDVGRRTTTAPVALAVLVAAVVQVARGVRRRGAGHGHDGACFVVALAVVPALLLVALSALLERTHGAPILQTRQLIFAMPALCLAVAVALDGFASRAAAMAVGCGLVLGALAAQPGFIPSQRHLAERIAADARPGDVVAVYPMRSWQVFAHAARGVLPDGVVTLPLVELDDTPERAAARLERVLDRTERLWVVERYMDALARDDAERARFDAVAAVLERPGGASRITLYDGPTPWQVRRYDRAMSRGAASPASPASPAGRTPIRVRLVLPPSAVRRRVDVQIIEPTPPAVPGDERWFGFGGALPPGGLQPGKDLLFGFPELRDGVWQFEMPSDLPYALRMVESKAGFYQGVAWRSLPFRFDPADPPEEITIEVARTRLPTWLAAIFEYAARLALVLGLVLEIGAFVRGRRKGDMNVAPTGATP